MTSFINKVTFSNAIALFVLLSTFSLTSFAASSTALKKIEGGGVTVECLAKIEPLGKQIHTWLVGHLKKNPFDMNQDFTKLRESQSKIIDYVGEQLAMKNPSDVLKKIIPDIFTKFQNIGNVIPNIRHLQVWTKKDLKEYLDGGGKIPGYSYTPGPDGENELKMEHGYQTSSSAPSEALTVDSPLFPLILKSDEPGKYFDESKETLTDMHKQFERMASGMAGLLMMMSIQPAIQDELRPPMRFFNWFSGGVAGFLTGQILNDFVSESAARNFIESQNIESFVRIAPQIHLVKWIGNDPKDKPKTPQEEILKKARYAFSIIEIMGLVQRNGPDCLAKVFAEIKKAAPFDKAKVSQKVSPKDSTGEELVQDLEALLNAIKSVTGENFRRRLLRYSQVSAPSQEKQQK